MENILFMILYIKLFLFLFCSFYRLFYNNTDKSNKKTKNPNRNFKIKGKFPFLRGVVAKNVYLPCLLRNFHKRADISGNRIYNRATASVGYRRIGGVLLGTDNSYKKSFCLAVFNN